MSASSDATKKPAKAYLQGGPCDGKTVTLTAASWEFGFIECKGVEYQIKVPYKYHHGDVIFFSTGEPPANPPQPKLNAPQALKGWSDLQRAFNRDLPASIHASARARSAALRELSRARKVKI